MTLHLAFSAGHFVNQASKIGGFAALVGLAVLVLLYFSQAREVKRLREWAAEEPDRAAELEQRLMAQAAAVRRTAAPRPAGQPATPAGVAARPQPAPFAPPGVAAPALASATRFPGLVPARPALAPVAAPAPVPAAAPAAAQAGGGGTTTIAPPVPATSNGRSTEDRPAVAATPPARAAAPPPARRSVQIRGQAAPLRSGSAASASPAVKDPHGRRWAILMGIGVVVIVTLVALLVTGALGGGGGGGKGTSASSTKPKSAGTAAPATKTKAKAKGSPFVRKNTTVSVINGTVTTGVATQTEHQLTKAGFGGGVAATSADQTHSATVVYYQPGHKRDAQEVQKVLKQGAIEALGGTNSATNVCALKQIPGQPQGNPCQSDVVVLVGSDVAH